MDQSYEPQVNQQNQFVAPEPRNKKTKTVVLAVIAVLLVIGFAAGGWWYGTTSVQKESDAKIAELKTKISELEKKASTASKATNTNSTSLSEEDITQLDKALTAACNADSKNQVYVVSDADGKTYTKISKAVFAKVGPNGDPKYYKNTVIIGVSCHDADMPDEPNGGYVSILQRQTDGSWKQVLGMQDVPSCDMVKQYAISSKIVPECVDVQGAKTVPNTIE